MSSEYTNKPEGPSAVSGAETEIDLVELARKLWNGRKLIFKWCIFGALAGLIIAVSIPKEYTVTVKLAPELSKTKRSLGGLDDLAAMAGVNIGSGSSSADAVYPKLYPDIVTSVPFLTELFKVPVSDRKGRLQTTVYDYMIEYQRAPWWSVVLSAPMKALGWTLSLFKAKEPERDNDTVDTFRLTRKQARAVRMLSERINCMVDKKSSVVTLSVTMQDPLIAATLTDTVMMNLQNYITEYRTTKARLDLAFTQQLFDEAQSEYYRAQSKYAHYLDANQNVVLRSVRTEQERLQNEMTLAYNVYSQMAQQLQLARAKVQESTPVYTVLEPATVPLRASKPSRLLILVGCALLAGAAAAVWVLFGRDLAAQFRKNAEKSGLQEE